MSENKGRINAWVFRPNPGLLWQASTFDPHEIVFAGTEAEAMAALEQVLGPRGLACCAGYTGLNRRRAVREPRSISRPSRTSRSASARAKSQRSTIGRC